MADADLSKIVGLIMENPNLIEEIRSLTTQKERGDEISEKSAIDPVTSKTEEEGSEPTRDALSAPPSKRSPESMRRRELLCALKPYVSDGRSKAIDSIISIAEILEVVRR